MLAQKLKIDSGIRILTFGSISIAIASFVKQNTNIDITSFLLSGIFLIFSGIFFLACNFFELPDEKIISNNKLSYRFYPAILFKQGCFSFVVFRTFCVACLMIGIYFFLMGSIGLVKTFEITRENLLSNFANRIWLVIILPILILLYCMFIPATYRDFE